VQLCKFDQRWFWLRLTLMTQFAAGVSTLASFDGGMFRNACRL
jgi:hypothetical protein